MQCFGSPQFAFPFREGWIILNHLYNVTLYLFYFIFIFFVLGRSGRCPKRNPKAVEFWRSCRLKQDAWRVDSPQFAARAPPPPSGRGAIICICYFALLASMLNAACSLHVC